MEEGQNTPCLCFDLLIGQRLSYPRALFPKFCVAWCILNPPPPPYTIRVNGNHSNSRSMIKDDKMDQDPWCPYPDHKTFCNDPDPDQIYCSSSSLWIRITRINTSGSILSDPDHKIYCNDADHYYTDSDPRPTSVMLLLLSFWILITYIDGFTNIQTADCSRRIDHGDYYFTDRRTFYLP